MQTPFTRKPGMDKQTRQPYQLFVDTDEAIQNRYLRMEQSTLSCSCTSDQSVDECRHIKERHLEFIRWKRAALQRLRMELTAGQPAAVIAQRITTKFGIPMDMTQVIVSDEGTLKLQGDPGISKRYSETCGWGFMGSRVYETPDPDEESLIYWIAQELELTCWSPLGTNGMQLIDLRLPHSLFKATQNGEENNHTPSGLYSGQGGVVALIDDQPLHLSPDGSSETGWAAYWTRLCGLDLIEGEWSKVDRYLPGGFLNGKPVAGLAFDLVNHRVKGIPAERLKELSSGVPAPYRNQVGHVHLPWGSEAETFPGGMVIVKHNENHGMDKDEPLTILTTNFWQDLEMPEHAYVHDLISVAAAYLVRMGHNPAAMLQYGNWIHPVGELAVEAETRLVTQSAFKWDITDYGMSVLREEIVPSVVKHEPIPLISDSGHEFGTDWPLFLPPEGGE